MRIEYHLPVAAQRALAAGDAWEGRATLIISPDEEERKLCADGAFNLNQYEARTLSLWDKVIAAEATRVDAFRGRNLTSAGSLNKGNRALLARSVKALGEERLSDLIRAYGAVCDSGDNVFDGRTVCYKDLWGFLRKVMTVHRNGGNLWFVKDAGAVRDYFLVGEPAKILADLYCTRILKTPKARLTQADVDNFRTAAAAIEKMTAKMPVSAAAAAGIAIDTLKENYRGPIYPAHLINRKFLSVVLPQTFARIY